MDKTRNKLTHKEDKGKHRKRQIEQTQKERGKVKEPMNTIGMLDRQTERLEINLHVRKTKKDNG